MFGLIKMVVLALGEVDKRMQHRSCRRKPLKTLAHHLRSTFGIFTPEPRLGWAVAPEAWSKKGWYAVCQALPQPQVRSDEHYYAAVFAFAQMLEDFDPTTNSQDASFLLYVRLSKILNHLLQANQEPYDREFQSKRIAA